MTKKKHNLAIFLVVAALIAGLWYMQNSSRKEGVIGSTLTATKAVVAGAELAYPSHYGVYEKANNLATRAVNTVVWYENTEQNKNFFAGGANAPSEPPVTMSLEVYSNPEGLLAKDLLGAGASYMFASNQSIPVVVGGVQGSLFTWDGLYRGRSIALNSKGVLYIFSVTSITDNDATLKDFDLLLSSVVFK